MNHFSSSAYIGVDDNQWLLFGSGGATSVEYLRSLQQWYPYPNCEFCTTISGTATAPLQAFASDGAGDFFFGYNIAQNIGYITPVNNGTLGAPISVPNPMGYNTDCTGFTAGGGTLMAAFMSLNAIPPGGSWQQVGTLDLQPVNEYSGALGTPAQITNVFDASCNVAMSTDQSQTGVAIATRLPGELGPGELFTTYNTFSLLQSTPLFGYEPLSFASMNTSHSWPLYWVMLDAFGGDYTRNANATSLLELVNTYNSYLHVYMPIGSLLNTTIPYNNRILAAGPNGMVYMLGAGGYEIAPFLTGL